MRVTVAEKSAAAPEPIVAAALLIAKLGTATRFIQPFRINEVDRIVFYVSIKI
jgi:hypothetical protein